MAISRSDIKLYRTSSEPSLAQAVYSQSVGGYPSTTLVYPETTLTANTGLYSNAITISFDSAMENSDYLSVNDEIVQVTAVTSANVTAVQRAVNGTRQIHLSGNVVRGLSSSSGLFNSEFNQNKRQYRCVALKNTSSTDTATDVSVYLKQGSFNTGSTIKLAVEMPLNDYETGTATSGSTMAVVNSSIATLFSDNHFSLALLRMTSGSNVNQERLIASYDDTTGTFTLASELPFAVSSGDTYAVEPGPAQRLADGTATPTSGVSRVSSFSRIAEDDAVSIDVTGSRDGGDDLMPNDVIYIWVERELTRDSTPYSNNLAVIGVNYKV